MSGCNGSNTNENSTMSFSPYLWAISGVSCSLSILGAMIIFLTYFMVPNIKNTTRKMFNLLTVADLLTSLGYLSSVIFYKADQNNVEYLQFCTFQSAVTTYSSMVSFFFTVAIAFHLFYTVYSQTRVTDQSSFLGIVCAVCWGFPGLIVVQALSYDKLGRHTAEETTKATTGPWCWVKCSKKTCTDSSSIAYMLVTGKLWEILAYVLTVSLYGLLKRQLVMRHEARSFREISDNLRDEDRNFLYVWAVFIAIRLSGTIRFFLNLIASEAGTATDQVFQHIQAFGDPSQAFFNCIIFCLLDRSVRNYFHRRIRGIRPDEFDEIERENARFEEADPLLENDIRASRDIRVSHDGKIDAGVAKRDPLINSLNKGGKKSYGSTSHNATGRYDVDT